MIFDRNLTRRGLVGAAWALALVGGAALAARVRPTTPAQGAGPFVPLEWSGDVDWDLVSVEGQPRGAYGQVMHVLGRVLDQWGEPISGAALRIWQADALGRYHHPGEPRGNADRYFRGFGQTVTDAEGRYRFRTVTPVPYQGRAPHIHFRVEGPRVRALTTQMYLEGNPRNRRDGLFMGVAEPARRALLEAEVAPADDLEAGAVAARFDLVLASSDRAL